MNSNHNRQQSASRQRDTLQELTTFHQSRAYLLFNGEMMARYDAAFESAMDRSLSDSERVHNLEYMRGIALSDSMQKGLIQSWQEDIKNTEEQEDD